MAAKDSVTKAYMSRNDIFSDAFNFLIYGGRQAIAPGKLRELDTAGEAAPFGVGGALETVQRYRDALKKIITMTDGEVAYLILGIEDQSEVHYAMPVRNMVYDALQYEKQVREKAKDHGLAGENKGLGGGEYLSGLHKGDRLTPVVTLVVYFGAREWDGPMSLSDILTGVADEVKPFVQDYRVFVVAPARLEKADLAKFRTSLGEVLSYIKYSNDKEGLRGLLASNKNFERLETDAAIVINKVTNSRLKINEGAVVTDMCLALEEIRLESEAKGEAIGEAKGEARGEIKGEAKGEAKFAQLSKILIAEKNYGDLENAADDPDYRHRLYRKYGIEETDAVDGPPEV